MLSVHPSHPSLSLELHVFETAGDVINDVARCELPFIFEIISKSSSSLGKRKRNTDEENASSSTVNVRNVRPRVEGVEDHAVTIDGRSNQLAAETQEPLATGSSSEPPVEVASEPMSSMAPQKGSSYAALSRPPPRPLRNDLAIIPEPGSDTSLNDTNPQRGSTNGGDRIALFGSNYPADIPLFARFGTHVASTVCSVVRNKCVF